MKIQVNIPNLKTLVSRMEKYPEISERHINNAINRSLVRVLGEEKLTAPVFTGNMRDNWTILFGRFQGTLQSNVPYSGYIQTGTRPHFPPIDEITPWARKKGIPPWALAMSIAKKGTKANPFMTRAIRAAMPGIQTEFREAAGAIIQDVASS